MKRMRIAGLLSTEKRGIEVVAAGWVRTRRDSKGGFSFIEINDGSCLANLQVIAPMSLPNYEDEILKLHPGASVMVEGVLESSEGSGQAVELKAKSVKVLGFSPPLDYPLGKQKINFERLRELPHLRARTNSFGAVARVRHTLAHEVHRFFHERGFLYVHTPIITANDCEGAGAMFQVTTLDPHAPPRRADGSVDYDQDFFGRRTSLTVSGQLEGETYACAMGDIYTFGPTFRAENSNTRRHLSEFWMIEPEMAFADLDDDAELAEAFLRHLFQAVLKQCGADLRFFDQRVLPGVLARLERLAEAPFGRVTYTEAIKLLEASGKAFEFAPYWGMDMQSEHERYLAEEVFKGAGGGDRLSRGDQGFLHAAQRRRKDRGGDGCAAARGWGDHRRQPARGAAGRAHGGDAQGRAESGRLRGLLGSEALRQRAARGLRPRLRAPRAVLHRHAQYPRRDPIPPCAAAVLDGHCHHRSQGSHVAPDVTLAV